MKDYGPGAWKRAIKPNGNIIKSRGAEISLGIALFFIAILLLWDAFDGRGRKMPWPAGGIMPW